MKQVFSQPKTLKISSFIEINLTLSEIERHDRFTKNKKSAI